MSYIPSYKGFSAIYDELMNEAPYDQWLQFLLKQMTWLATNNKKILDLGCGTGRLACELAKRGFQVTGLDISEEMLAMAADRMEREKVPQFPLVQQDMCEMELNQTYGIIYSFCDSLNYLLDEDELTQTFSRVAEHLEHGGLFLFDMHSPYKITNVYAQGPIVDDDEKLSYIWVPYVDEETLRVDHHIHFFVQEEDGRYRRFSEIHAQRAYLPEQIRTWLEQAGFILKSVTADFTDMKPTPKSERLFFVAQKKL